MRPLIGRLPQHSPFPIRNSVFMFFVSSVELTDFKTRRIAHYKKNLIDLAEFEIKHARVSIQRNRSFFVCLFPR